MRSDADIKWDNDKTLISPPRRRVTLELALYAMHVGSGGSLLCKSIKAGTVRQYIWDVSTVLRRLGCNQRDFSREDNSNKALAEPISRVLKELE
jgi:hypothetical protein